jgi:hypothetical protein
MLFTVRDKFQAWGRPPQKGTVNVMKKLLVILCVLVLLALVVVPVLAGALSAVDGPNRQMAPKTGGFRGAEKEPNRQMAPRDPGTFPGAEAPIWVQMARGTYRSPSA